MATPGDKITVTETLPTGCVGVTKEFPIIVSPTKLGEPVVGAASVCKGATGVSYRVTDTPGTTYAWSLPPGAFIVGPNNVHEVFVTFPIDAVGQVSVVETNGACTIIDLPLPVTIHPLPIPALAGNGSVCINSAGNIYTTDAGMTAYVWNVSAGGTVTAGGTAGDNTVTVTWNTAGAQSVSVNYTNGSGCTATGPTVKTVAVNPLPVPTLSGNANACQNSTGNVYTTESGMSAYVWSVSAGGAITSGGTAGSNSAVITWNTPGAQTVSVSYTNTNGCIAAAPAVYPVTVNPLPVPTITGNASVCVGSTGNNYTTEAGMTNYIWSVSAGGVITAGGTGSDNVTVTWTTAGARSVSVNYTNLNNCTAAAPTVKAVTVNPLPVPTLTGPSPVCVTTTGHLYTTEAGMTGYTWVISGGTITTGGGAGDNTATVTWNSAGTQSISVNYTNGDGCTAAAPNS